jgi:hypothetical protein
MTRPPNKLLDVSAKSDFLVRKPLVTAAEQFDGREQKSNADVEMV